MSNVDLHPNIQRQTSEIYGLQFTFKSVEHPHLQFYIT